MKNDDSIFTAAVHAGDDRSKHFGAVSMPIYPSSVFAFEDAETGSEIHNNRREGYFYGLLGNPTQTALERAMAELEGGEAAIAFASGRAAITSAIFSLIKVGEHVVAPESLYATTNLFFDELQSRFGVSVTYVDATSAENYADAVQENTKLFYIETPANPTLKITDIESVVKIAKQNNIQTVLDSTFATPFNQQSLKLGVDAVIHSATKYLGGHSDLTAGVLVGKQETINKVKNYATKLFGSGIAPQIAWLVLRGIKTLALRMERHNENAFAVANILAKHPKVVSVFYPGLKSHPQYEIARKQMRGFGGMIAFDVGSLGGAHRLVNNLRLCTLATSLGGVETIIQPAASMTYAAISANARKKAGIPDGLLRLSVGIENADDIIADLEKALKEV
ncbi:MAG: PLP-dependent aspartate aminotransferase family protein [Acidobacteriota bacterium]|nr:PLP-dependent aspartate aminotransferase family protein [Acidobacteriota bacterium]